MSKRFLRRSRRSVTFATGFPERRFFGSIRNAGYRTIRAGHARCGRVQRRLVEDGNANS